jgi:integrase
MVTLAIPRNSKGAAAMLYKRPHSAVWWCRFTPPNSKQIRRSTQTAVKKDAEEYEAKLKSECWRQAKLGEKPRFSWQEAVVRWLEETEHKASHRDDVNLLRYLDQHLSTAFLDEITTDRVDAIARARKATGVKNATINRMLALISAILRRAERQWGWLDHAPALRRYAVSERRIRWLTHDEADRLLAELPEHLAEMARFTLATGLRAANVCHLAWNQIDLERRVAWIHPDQAKARRAIGVPLNTDAVLVLRRCQGKHLDRVFTYHGAPVAEANSRAWYKALERAGIEDFRWHDLRHTWASWHIQSGTPLHVLQELGGWASYDMVQRYAHLAPEHLAEHAARLETKKHILSTQTATATRK